jgi:hypothetical protein
MITPSDSPSSPADFAGVTPHGQGPAPYDIQAPQADLTAAFDAANAAGGQGVLYPRSERQTQTKGLMESPAGFGLDGYDIDAGLSFGWPANIEPGG